MNTLKRSIFLILFIPFFCHSQEYDKKALGIGFSTFAASNNLVLPLPYSVSVIGNYKRHELGLGCDIYNSFDVILGVHANHKYYLLNKEKVFNIFTDFSLHYLNYGMGGTRPVRYYNYSNPDENWIQTKSLLNTFGIGFRLLIVKKISLFSVFSGGYNYYERKYSPTNKEETGIIGFNPGSYFVPIFYIKLGISVKLYRTLSN